MKTYEIWDLDTSNIVGDFHSLEEARIAGEDLYPLRPAGEDDMAVIVEVQEDGSDPVAVEWI